jgi:cytochrome c oxidase assembly protein subunit 15
VDPIPLEARRDCRVAARGFLALAVAGLGLIVVGALVRAHGAGLACPDWPLCFGTLVPAFDFRIAFEWGHRVFAGALSLGLGAATLFALRRLPLRGRLAGPLLVAWALLATQVVLGGSTVLLGLAPWTVVSHLVVGNLFTATLFWIARTLGEAARSVAPRPAREGRALVAACLGLLALQVVLGGLVSSQYAGLACDAFPTCDGTSLAPALAGPVGLHVIHRLGACALVVAVAALAWRTRRAPEIGRLARAALALVLAQVAVGAANVLASLPVELTGLHTGLAAALVLVHAELARKVLAPLGAARGAADRAPRRSRALEAA